MSDDIQIIENFITTDEEEELKLLVDQYADMTEKKRQVVRFGKFNPCSYGIIIHQVPDIINNLKKRLIDEKYLTLSPESTSLNIYTPGATVLPHIDNVKHCGPIIVVIGLFANNDLLFKKCKNGLIDKSATAESKLITFPRRSLMILQGDMRYNWAHETLPIDVFRASIVFRTRLDGVDPELGM